MQVFRVFQTLLYYNLFFILFIICTRYLWYLLPGTYIPGTYRTAVFVVRTSTKNPGKNLSMAGAPRYTDHLLIVLLAVKPKRLPGTIFPFEVVVGKRVCVN